MSAVIKLLQNTLHPTLIMAMNRRCWLRERGIQYLKKNVFQIRVLFGMKTRRIYLDGKITMYCTIPVYVLKKCEVRDIFQLYYHKNMSYLFVVPWMRLPINTIINPTSTITPLVSSKAFSTDKSPLFEVWTMYYYHVIIV